MSKSTRSNAPTANLLGYRAYMGLPSVLPTASALDLVHAKLYGIDGYDRPWDEAEARHLSNEELHLELTHLASKYDHFR